MAIRGTTKQYVLGGLVGLGFVAAVAGVIWTLMTWMSEDIDQAAGLLPENTILLVAFQDVDELHEDFSSLMELDVVQEHPEVAVALEILHERLELDVMDMNKLRETGLDFGGVWALAAVLNNDEDPTEGARLYALVPVEDENAAVDFVTNRLESGGLEVKEQGLDDYDAWVIQENEDESMAFMVKEDFLVFALDWNLITRGDGISALEELVDMKGSLDDSESFQRIKEDLGDDWNGFAYARFDTLDSIFEGWLGSAAVGLPTSEAQSSAMLGDLANYSAMGITMGVDREEMSFKMSILRNDGNWSALSGDGVDTLAPYIDGQPLVAMRTSYDMDAYWSYIDDLYGDLDLWQQALDEFELETGLDLKEDIAAVFTGNFSFVVLAGSGFIPLDVYMWAEVHDEARATALVERLAELAEYEGLLIEQQETRHVDWYYTDLDVYSPSLGIGRNHLIFSLFDKGRADLSDSLQEEEDSFVDELPDPLDAEFLEGSLHLAWIDIAGLVDALADAPELRHRDDWALMTLFFAPFQELSARSSVDGALMHSEVTIHAREGDFIPAMESAIEDGIELAEEMSPGRWQPPPD